MIDLSFVLVALIAALACSRGISYYLGDMEIEANRTWVVVLSVLCAFNIGVALIFYGKFILT